MSARGAAARSEVALDLRRLELHVDFRERQAADEDAEDVREDFVDCVLEEPV